MIIFHDIDKEDDDAIIEKFEPVNIKDDFVILPRKESDPYRPDFKYVTNITQMIRTYYEVPLVYFIYCNLHL
jgi:hypothetical protein